MNIKGQVRVPAAEHQSFFPSFDASNFHKLVDESSQVRPSIVAIVYFVRVCEGGMRRQRCEWYNIINTFGSLVQVNVKLRHIR